MMSSFMNKLVLLVIILAVPVAMAQSEILPDPTRPAQYQETLSVQEMPQSELEWNLTAIRISDTDRSAIVNGQIVRPGQIIGQAKLAEIRADEVILEHDNRKIAVKLIKKLSLRKPSSEITKIKSKS